MLLGHKKTVINIMEDGLGFSGGSSDDELDDIGRKDDFFPLRLVVWLP